MENNTLLKMVGITKTFPGVKALDGVNFEVKTGEIISLMDAICSFVMFRCSL